MHIEHIGIATKDIQNSRKIFETLLQTKVYKVEEVETEQVTTAFLKLENTKIELLQGKEGTKNAISTFIEKKGEGIHHIAFEVKDIYKEIERLKKEGFVPIHEIPRKGADNKMVCFFHPKQTNGVLIEICQEIKS
ncbi:MAG: methylmalonyl-CoA epimerase [Chitinophagaceae bacterium]|nr:methylmalonyl-CoA epimerase [Chitinophagaceae bacterium]